MLGQRWCRAQRWRGQQGVCISRAMQRDNDSTLPRASSPATVYAQFVAERARSLSRRRRHLARGRVRLAARCRLLVQRRGAVGRRKAFLATASSAVGCRALSLRNIVNINIRGDPDLELSSVSSSDRIPWSCSANALGLAGQAYPPMHGLNRAEQSKGGTAADESALW
ncbi:hypothetical protein B0H15DRAFT_442472 [Mycena belliarum]|uniref:Uncharacterized protein n=1 Tax=Mycena belliarum TaxID=1033014 RepID=A0AAD6XIX8_9AGAR|nr:hypothetical protein B0H15DRAFT_442472 [Mycena belliae]